MRVIFFLIATFFLFSATAEDFKVPSLKGPVNDYAQLLPRSNRQQLTQTLIQLKQSGGSEIAILTMPSLSGSSIEQASIKVTDKWKLGDKAKDNGILILIAKKERKIRIEVGQGLEGLLTDAHSKRIISEVMAPLFRSGNVSQGILLGVFQVASKANPKLDMKTFFGNQNWKSTKRPRKKGGLGFLPLIIIIFFIFSRGRRGGGGLLLAGMLLGGSSGGRGGGGGFGSGGGGFGGGGGFSGGGASGGW